MTKHEPIEQNVKPRVKRYLPWIVVAVFAVPVAYFQVVSPKPDIRPMAPPPKLIVETQAVQAQDFTIFIKSYGRVAARTKTSLSAQVSGKVVSINPGFNSGAFFKKGDVLLTIEQGDFQADVDIARASVMQARQQLDTEQAESIQAEKNWRISGNKGAPSDLVLRKPQLKAAEATLLAAEAQLKKAMLNLERTVITAPFDGRVLDRQVSLGQIVSANTVVADIFATDIAEVRLPVQNTDLPFLDFPEQRIDQEPVLSELPPVVLTSGINAKDQWLGHVVRTEGRIDDDSRQLHVVAEVVQPFSVAEPAIDKGDRAKNISASSAMEIGQYVTATITGKTLKNALVIPASAISQGRFVYLVENNVLQRKVVTIAWQAADYALISDGLHSGDQLVLTPLGQVTSGTAVEVRNEK